MARTLGWAGLFLLAFFADASMSNGATSQPASQSGRPNILFIYTDDQSWNTLSCYSGRPWVRTPNIDRLAEQGVRFNYAYGAGWCAPSRACSMTGLQLHAIRGLQFKGIIEGQYDPAVCRFWPSELRKGGYRTTLIGKWHLGHDSGHGRDWDHSVVWDQADIKGDWYNDQILSVDGAEKKIVPGYSTDVYTRFAVEEIKRPHEKPWFMWLCYNAPHLPYTVAPRHKDQYQGVEVPIPSDVFGPRPGKPQYMQKFTMWQRDKKKPDGPPVYSGGVPLPEMVRAYQRVVCSLDDGVGQLLTALAETGQLDNTFIVYTSDQGFALGERGFAWKVGPYEACMRMPLIMRLPGRVTKGGICQQPVALVDLPPTFFAMAGLPPPWTMHGHDLQPLLKDPQAEWDHPAMLEYFRWEFGAETDRGVTGDAAMRGIPWWIGLWKGRYKYVRNLLPNEIEELYDFAGDPDEMQNLALQPEYRHLLADYRNQMTAELLRTKAGLVENLPAPQMP